MIEIWLCQKCLILPQTIQNFAMISLAQRKYNFIEKYVQITNPKILEQLEQVLDENLNHETLDLTDELKDSIDAGLKSLDSGKGILHNGVINGLKQKFPELRF
jgi:hypothetical protein